MEIKGHDKYVEWQEENGVKTFYIAHNCYPKHHTEYIGASEDGRFFLIWHFTPATYDIEEISEKEAKTTVRGLALRCVEEEFEAFLESIKEGVKSVA